MGVDYLGKRGITKKCVIPCALYDSRVGGSGGGGTTFVIRVNYQFVLEAGVESSMSPVGLEVDSCIRMLAWGCRRGSPGVFPSLTPFSERGVAH